MNLGHSKGKNNLRVPYTGCGGGEGGTQKTHMAFWYTLDILEY